MRTLLRALSIVSVVCLVAAVARSADENEPRKPVKEPAKKVDQPARKGQPDEDVFERPAQKQRATDKPRKGEQHQVSERELDELHQQLKALTEKERQLKESGQEEGLAEIRERMMATKWQIGEFWDAPKRPQASQHDGKHQPQMAATLEDAGRRIKHLRIAAENLHAAGLHDVAEELAQRAEGMEREAHQAKERLMAEMQAHGKKAQHIDETVDPDPLGRAIKESHARGQMVHEPFDKPRDAAVEELRREVQQLRAELKELREALQSRR